MTSAHKSPHVYTIPPTLSFVDTLAAGLLQGTKDTPDQLSRYLILLPTRRACRNLREGFLRQTNGKPLLLPRMQALGDIDAEELVIMGGLEFDIPPAIPPIRRQIILAKLISKLSNYSRSFAQDMKLAQSLGRLMDQIYTENLDLSLLPQLVDREELAHHWKITTEFLDILHIHWPKILAEEGVIDAADRRNRLLLSLDQHWQDSPPNHPVIAAGSTGSIPATAALLKTVANLDNGSVVLPSLDNLMNDEAWDNVQEGHPQATLKNLLNIMDVPHRDVPAWKNYNGDHNKQHFVSHIMAPAEHTHQWGKEISLQPETISHITRYDCDTSQDEAHTIAIIIRETLETPNKTAALITPDRNLATRVSSLCRRWGIILDDSGGEKLINAPIGVYFSLVFQCALNDLKPVSLLSLLKHNLCCGIGIGNYRSLVRDLDKNHLRGITSQARLEKVLEKTKNKNGKISDFVQYILDIFSPLVTLIKKDECDFIDFLNTHIQLAENLHNHEDNTALWHGEEGISLHNFLKNLLLEADTIGAVTAAEYFTCLQQMIDPVMIRPRYGTHPRLSILGTLEARMINSDRIIMAGLNEGTWPNTPAHDPWMSRPMQKKFGLPSSERSITLSAHDFTLGLCGKEVFITRSLHVDNAPTTPSRWLERLDTYLIAQNIDPLSIHGNKHTIYANALNRNSDFSPIERPTPTPPTASRPTQLSVTKIETWIRDPYAIYAEKILNLRALEALEKNIDNRECGNILHDTFDQFIQKYPEQIPSNSADDLITIGKDIFEKTINDKNALQTWMPRLIKISDWFTNHERQWRNHFSFAKSEALGKIVINDNFTLTARADRIDRKNDGSYAIIDYKSGGSFSMKSIESATAPQLPLEGYILQQSGFEDLSGSISYMGYWKVTGTGVAGETIALSDGDKCQGAIDNAVNGLQQLIEKFSSEDTPYISLPNTNMAPRFNDYLYLARVKEWTALDDNTGESAA